MITRACYGLTVHKDTEDNVEEQDRPDLTFQSLQGETVSVGWVTSNQWR